VEMFLGLHILLVIYALVVVHVVKETEVAGNVSYPGD
jgi:hypothetical protein